MAYVFREMKISVLTKQNSKYEILGFKIPDKISTKQAAVLIMLSSTVNSDEVTKAIGTPALLSSHTHCTTPAPDSVTKSTNNVCDATVYIPYVACGYMFSQELPGLRSWDQFVFVAVCFDQTKSGQQCRSDTFRQNQKEKTDL